MYKNFFKRVLDILLSLIALPFLLIVFIIFAPIIVIEDRGPVFYKAKRRGRNGKIFKMYKFRSMKTNSPDLRNKDGSTYNSSNDPRITKIGKFMRKTSIDEFPQILNVFIGDMSFIGPRAPIPKDGCEWEDLDEMRKKRLQVRPGLTGYTAALYRNSIPADEKLVKDCYYVDHVSFGLDVKIIFWTIKTVLLRRNIYTNQE